MPLALALLLLASGARPFADERLLLDRRLETLRRILPDGPAPAADAALVAAIGQGVGLPVEAVARAPLETGARGDVPVDVSAVGRFADIDRFFRQVALSPRLIDVESLSLRAAPGDLVRLTALVHLPYRPVAAPLPPVPEGARAGAADAPRPQADAFLRDQALSLAKSEAIATLRRTRRNPRLFLAELASVVRDRPVVLREATLADEFAIRGLTVGEGPMRALEARLERGFFRITEVLMARQGACHRFEAHGKSPVVGIEAELPLPSVDDPFRQDEAPCVVDRDSGPVQVLRAAAARPARARAARPAGPPPPPPGTLTLRLRDLDLADVVEVLHLVTGQAFVVDGDVRGRLSLEATDATLDAVLALLGRAGIAVSAAGPLRRVSRGEAAPILAPPAGAALADDTRRVTVTVKRADVRDLLAVIAEADPASAWTAPGRLGVLSVFADDLAAGDLLAGIRAAADLEERADRVLAPRASGAAPRTAEVPPERRLALASDQLSTAEFRLAGLARSGGGWLALAYAPTGTLNAYRRGDRLADGAVAEIESTDVLLSTEEGYSRALLPDLPR